MFGIDRLKPYGLPNARSGSVPNARSLALLFSHRLITIRSGIENFHGKFVAARLECARYVHAERSETAGVIAHTHAVHKHFGFPVNSSEIEFHILAFPCGRYGKRAIIPQDAFLGKRLAHSRKR